MRARLGVQGRGAEALGARAAYRPPCIRAACCCAQAAHDLFWLLCQLGHAGLVVQVSVLGRRQRMPGLLRTPAARFWTQVHRWRELLAVMCRWITYISPIQYGFMALMKNEFEGFTIYCEPSQQGCSANGTRSGETVLEVRTRPLALRLWHDGALESMYPHRAGKGGAEGGRSQPTASRTQRTHHAARGNGCFLFMARPLRRRWRALRRGGRSRRTSACSSRCRGESLM